MNGQKFLIAGLLGKEVKRFGDRLVSYFFHDNVRETLLLFF